MREGRGREEGRGKEGGRGEGGRGRERKSKGQG